MNTIQENFTGILGAIKWHGENTKDEKGLKEAIADGSLKRDCKEILARLEELEAQGFEEDY